MKRKIWFTSDTHFNHANIIKYCKRRFALTNDELDCLDNKVDFRVSRESTAYHDEYLLDLLNSNVGADDTLWHLGDFCFGPKHVYFETAKRFRDKIKCKHINFIYGNHDTFEIGKLFESATEFKQIYAENQSITLCHYALAVWNKSHRGSWHLYGHSHATAEPWFDKNMKGRRSFDVGVDNAKKLLGDYRPFSLDDIRGIMSTRKGFSFDHHEDPWLGKDNTKSEEEVMEEYYEGDRNRTT